LGLNLTAHPELFVNQRREWAEFLGIETRNKYEIQDASGGAIGFAAEQQKGLIGQLWRQFLGHWRSFDIHIFDTQRVAVLVAHHPFRWFFQRLEVTDARGVSLGALQKRFSLFTKEFDVQDARGNVFMEVRCPVWKMWTFPFFKKGTRVATVEKKWSGLFTEAFTDRDRFRIEFSDRALSEVERSLILAAAIFIDLQYFETKAD
jgi:uncharacterized protein YxjI